MIFNTGLEAIINGICAAYSAQLLKFLGHLLIYRKIDFKVLTTTGGMPSSHTAGVVGLTLTVGLISGFMSVDFAIAMGFTVVVMYDAAGVRRSAGKIAASLNKMMADFYEHRPADAGERLKELLGHTPFEVLMGALYGIAFACLMHYVIFG